MTCQVVKFTRQSTLVIYQLIKHREALVQGLIDSDFDLRIDSVSTCLHNAEKPNGTDSKIEIMSRYLFYLAFENQCEDDYITEKVS